MSDSSKYACGAGRENFQISSINISEYLKVADHELLPKGVQYFGAGSNSGFVGLRYIMLGAAVATAAGQPEDAANLQFDRKAIIKRIRYNIGVNTRNAVTIIGLRKNLGDVSGTVLSIDPTVTMTFDTGPLVIELQPTDRVCWKWDTSTGTGSLMITYQAEVEFY